MASSGLSPVGRPTRPARHAKEVLRRHAAPFAIIIAKLEGLAAILVDNDDDIQAAVTGPSAWRGHHQHGQPQNARTVQHPPFIDGTREKVQPFRSARGI
jgi:hypothetical protein